MTGQARSMKKPFAVGIRTNLIKDNTDQKKRKNQYNQKKSGQFCGKAILKFSKFTDWIFKER